MDPGFNPGSPLHLSTQEGQQQQINELILILHVILNLVNYLFIEIFMNHVCKVHLQASIQNSSYAPGHCIY